MDLIVYAVPFFILAMLLELVYGVVKQRNTYRLSDSISSLFLGTLSQGRRFVVLGVGGYVYYLITQHFTLSLMDPGHWFTWLLAFVLYDFCYYWLHRFGHERTILWAAHVAHHQSEDYNLSTALRQTSTGFLLGWVFYIPMYLLGIPAEVVVTVGSLNLIYQFWVHTEHVPKLGWYEWFFVTPSNHRVHHAQNDAYLDRNYGGVFIIWDRLFGTFQEELDNDPPIYGIRGPLRSWNPLKALSHVYIDMARDSWHARDWRDKLRVWWARTGWRPADVEARFPAQKTDLASFTKYDPKITGTLACYALFQLLAVVVLLNFMQAAELSYVTGLALYVLMLATTVTTALWLDQRKEPKVWEWLRLGFAGCLLVIGWQGGGAAAVLYAGAFYLIVNALFLPCLSVSQEARVEVGASSLS
ncbi:sterol desaturase family protein [Parahaliea sp. F7430]|uniref:Sterol desaturase family protein n=1 Tax=Sediminihaliea albiluteola TaxID=2758564 RepID=A0A7W2TTD2_9GAMM|nr:sterol desaturase family protein [Sediminihaliea albiluteola]MBA6411539.1 sterol desaturase family protein [Sediminihaliea albiluteola]